MSSHRELPDLKYFYVTGNDRFHHSVLTVLFTANIFDMGGGFAIKYISYILMLAAIFLQFPAARSTTKEISIFFLMFIVMPLVSILVGLSNGGNLTRGISQITPFFPAFVLLIYLKPEYARVAWRSWYLAMRYFALFVIALFIIIALRPDSAFVASIVEMLNKGGQGYFGYRSIAAITIPNVYFKATLFLVPAFAYALFVNHRVSAFVIAAALFVAFSKAALLFCVLLLLVLWLRSIALNRFSFGQLAAVVACCIALYAVATELFLGYLSLVIDAISGKSETATVRLGHISSVIAMIAERPSFLLVGQGVGTEFYSVGTRSMVGDIELDHLDAIRQFGLPWFIAFSALFVLIIRTLVANANTEDSAVGIALFSLFIVAGTNPVLINPLSMLLLVTAWKLTQEWSSPGRNRSAPTRLDPRGRISAYD